MKFYRLFAFVVLDNLAVGFFAVSHAPFCLPTFIFCLTPLVVNWRSSLSSISSKIVACEAFFVGLLMGWSATYSMLAAMSNYTWILYFIGCMLYSFQIIALGLTIFWTRKCPIFLAAPILVLVSLSVEFVQAQCAGVVWILTNPPLAVASTPLAQWANPLSPFGLSAMLYAINFLLCPDYTFSSWLRWLSTIFAILLTSVLWIGGKIIETSVPSKSIPFAVALVQPSPLTGQGMEMRTLHESLHSLTLESLKLDGITDLVLWPEVSLEESERTSESRSDSENSRKSVFASTEAVDVYEFRRRFVPLYETVFLVGVAMVEERASAGVVEAAFRRNCGCLVSESGIDCHEKLVVVPFREAIPNWLDSEIIRTWSRNRFGRVANTVAGNGFRPLKLVDRLGFERNVAVAICYESWFPWLPQYHCKEPLDAICHLAYDGDFKDHPEYTQRMLLTIRLRAIETRTWQLVCTHYSSTAVIDPRGRIVKQLPPGPGVLRTDQLE